MKLENEPICICKHYHAESDRCGLMLLYREVLESELERCKHIQCAFGYYESVDTHGMSLEEQQEYLDSQPSWAELFGFEEFTCIFGDRKIVREFV